MSVFEHQEFDHHEQVLFCHDKASGLKAIIAIHNTNLGPALGGCRMWNYADSHEALTDVLRLSKGMTYKNAMANLKLGGGKSVIIGDPRSHKSEAMMQAMGKFVDTAGGRYITAEDSGISLQDLSIMAKHSAHICGIQSKYSFHGGEADGNPAPATSYGVFTGLKAAVQYQLKSDLKGVRVAIQGLGHVGYRLAKQLHDCGAQLFVTDIYPEMVKKAEQEFGAIAVSPEEIHALDVDVFAPCALGAIVNDRSVEQIKAKVIAGAANNQLANEKHGTILRERGILYAPDYVINAGGVIDIYHQNMPDSSGENLKAHLEQISETLLEIFERADAENKATNIVSNTIAEERIGI
ncbi:MAG: Glu/Leu/Phe/Val dehydrogenase dimerization domain-containing protein [Aestuariibacter sp.]